MLNEGWGLGVVLNPSLNIVYTRPQVEMSSTLLVGVKKILIIRNLPNYV